MGSWEYFQIYKYTFLCDFSIYIFLVWMGVIVMFGGISKNFSICKYLFYKIKSRKQGLQLLWFFLDAAVYTNLYRQTYSKTPFHEKSISDDSIPSLKPTYCPSSLAYSARILFTTHEGVTLLTSLPNLVCTNQQNCL